MIGSKAKYDFLKDKIGIISCYTAVQNIQIGVTPKNDLSCSYTIKDIVMAGPSLIQLAVVPLNKPRGPSDLTVFIKASRAERYLPSTKRRKTKK